MQLQPGIVLKSTPDLDDPVFAGAVIFISTYNAEGAVGFVVNRPFGRSLNELEEFRHSAAFPLFDGGPVDREHLFFLHRRPDLVEEGTAVANGIYSGGNFGQVVAGINAKRLSLADVKLFVGYCGWDAGELEAEVKEGSWILADEDNSIIFNPA